MNFSFNILLSHLLASFKIGDSAIINAALIVVYQMQLRGKVVGGPAPLLMTQLRDYEKHGTPTIPAGVRTELIPPQWLYNLALLDYISKVKEILSLCFTLHTCTIVYTMY